MINGPMKAGLHFHIERHGWGKCGGRYSGGGGGGGGWEGASARIDCDRSM